MYGNLDNERRIDLVNDPGVVWNILGSEIGSRAAPVNVTEQKPTKISSTSYEPKLLATATGTLQLPAGPSQKKWMPKV